MKCEITLCDDAGNPRPWREIEQDVFEAFAATVKPVHKRPMPKSKRQPHMLLDWKRADELRRKYKLSISTMAERFGCSRRTVCRRMAKARAQQEAE